MTSIEGDDALAAFRAGLTGARGLELLERHGGRALIELPVGVGKSAFLDAITAEAVAGGRFDLVVVLAPTRRLLRERRPLAAPPPGVRVVELRPRPAHRCGPDRDAAWKGYEAADLGALGRAEVCGRCPLLDRCFWPRQYGKALEGARVVYATQAHVESAPRFLARLRSWVGAERVLTLVDETDLAGKSFGEVVTADALGRFADALRAAAPACADPRWGHARWLSLTELLLGASTADLQAPGWRMPPVYNDWAVAVQRHGRERHAGAFLFLGHRLAEFGSSPVETRLRGAGGELHFASRPLLGDALVFSGTTAPEYVRYRLGEDLASPFAGYRFSNSGTRWFNLASPIGTRRYFPRHAPQVLDFFAELTARRAAAGKRVLLVARKCFVGFCAAGLSARLAGLGADLRVVTADWSAAALADPRVVPLISYGMVGTNSFEHFDCAFCLTGYYVDAAAVDQCLQDLTRPDLRLPIRVETVGDPRRRRAGVADPAHRDYDVARLAQPALEFKEHGVVVQAVGRVRPFTRPREVVTFQMADLPGVRYDAEFRTLAEARRHFGVATGRARRTAARAARVASLRAAGHSQAEVALMLGVTERTVRNYEKERAGKNPSSNTCIN
jgi:hypothetical protein